MALAVVLFLYDSSLLLYSNEALLITNAKRRWMTKFGANRFVIAGRTLALLNPFGVGQPAFRLQWQLDVAEENHPDMTWETFAQQVIRLRWWAWGAWCGLFVALPLGLFTAIGAPAIWAAVAMSYGSALGGVIHLWFSRHTFSITGSTFALLAFEAVLCPPFAANLVRRIAMRHRVLESFPHAAGRLLRGDERVAARAQCESLLTEELATTPAPESAALHARKLQVSKWLEGA